MSCIIKRLFIFIAIFVLAFGATAQVRVIDNKGTIREIDSTKWALKNNNIYNKNSQNVGIGNTAPNNKLEITQGTVGNSGLRFTNLTIATTPTLGSDKFLTVDSNGDVVLRNVGENIVDFSVNNNPNTAGTTFVPDDVQNRDVVYYSTIDNSSWKWNGTSYVPFTTTSSSWLQGGNTVGALRNLGTKDNFDLPFITNNTEKMRLSADGNLGIGTTSPAAKLDVNGNVQATSFVKVGGTASQFLKADGSIDTSVYITNTPVSSSVAGIVNNISLQELGGVDKTINGVRIGKGNGSGNASNTALGINALNANGNGSNNTAIGANTLRFNSTGSSNTAVGQLALNSNQTGSNNTALGMSALTTNSTGSSNIALGVNSLRDNLGGAVGEGSYNIAIGTSTLVKNISGSYNIALGTNALSNNTTSSNNIAVGYNSMFNNTGAFNVAMGSLSLYSNTSGINNVATGYYAGNLNTTGSDNVMSGYKALSFNNSGSGNVVIGSLAAANNNTITQLDSSVLIGKGAMPNNNGEYNEIVIGANTIGNGSNSVTIGDVNITKTILKGNIGIDTTTPANKLEITQGTSGNSGLRFTNLTTATTPTLGSDKFLTVDTNGDVVLRNVGENIVDFTSSDNNPNTAGTTFVPNDIQNRDVIYSSTGDNSLWKWTGSIYVAYTPTSTAWLQGGNAVTVQRNLGTVTNFNLPIVTNNIPRMTVLSSATVQTTQIGVATTTPTFTAPTNTGVTIPTFGVDGTVNATNYTTPVQPTFTGAAVTWDMSKGSAAKWTLAAGANTLTVSNMKPGMYGSIVCTNTGTSTLTFGGGGAINKVINGGGGVPVLTPVANAVDILTYFYDGTTFWWTVGNNYN